ncbi:MAG: hypothetical protein N4A54_09645 [Peptostreptococcaceae bacterium]|jgi:hypothetical protein|nr:hypothetical protein [Peptostreptococcaceae bacterium]
MEYLEEKLNNLKLLSKSLDESEDKAQNKVILNIVDILDDFYDVLSNLKSENEFLKENFLEYEDEDEDYEEDDFNFISINCDCGEIINLDEDILLDSNIDIVCPSCKKNIDMN